MHPHGQRFCARPKVREARHAWRYSRRMGSPPQSSRPTLEMKESASALGAHLTHQKIRSQHLYSREWDHAFDTSIMAALAAMRHSLPGLDVAQDARKHEFAVVQTLEVGAPRPLAHEPREWIPAVPPP